jgi:hypothetical protein
VAFNCRRDKATRDRYHAEVEPPSATTSPAVVRSAVVLGGREPSPLPQPGTLPAPGAPATRTWLNNTLLPGGCAPCCAHFSAVALAGSYVCGWLPGLLLGYQSVSLVDTPQY